MLDKDEDLLREFREEAQDILTSLEELLLQNSNLGNNSGVINELFRGVHTIKGSAGFLKQKALAELSHALESVLGAMREGFKPNIENIQDLFLGGLDHLKKALYNGTPAPQLIETLNALIEQNGPKNPPCDNNRSFRIAMDLTFYENQGARSILNLINVLSTGGEVSPLETGMAIQDLGHELIPQPLLVFFNYCSSLRRDEIIHLINSPFIQVDEVSLAPPVLSTSQVFPHNALSELTPGNLQPLGIILQWIELQLQQDTPKPPRKKILEQIKKIAELLLMGECEFQEGLNWMQPLVLKLEQPEDAKPNIQFDQNDREMAEDSKAILEKFLQHHLESLEQLEHLILNWEKDPKQHVSNLKRYLHTLKGESGALGFDNISMQLHLLEQALEEDTCTADQLLSWRDSFRAFLQECTGKKNKVAVTDKNMEIPAFVQENSGQDSLRVSTHKIDSMLDAIGEAVIAQSMIAGDDFFCRRLVESTEVHKIQVLRKIAKMEQILRQIQELSMSMRMVNLKSSFQKMKRMVRDLSKNLDKNVDFITEGEETELDKTVVDEMGAILVHLVRNAMDHGLENPEGRIRAGKNPKGRVILKAMHKSGNVVLMISDDGKGMDPEKLREKALSMGIAEAQNMRPEECLHLIFLPGFSTAQSVTDVSGRGVGMDVVRQSLEKLGGTIDVKSNLGSGTSFTLKLPINLAIMSGIVIRLNAEKYIIPTLSILETVQITKQEIQTVQGTGTYYALRGQLTKIVFLHHIFNDHFLQAEDDRYIGLLVEDAQGRKCLLMCDEILDQQQVVIKKIQSDKQMAGFAGGAIMKDGTVSLIVDTNQVLSNQLKEEA
jgi:chemotaxis protein histidine kinase CheA